jgi:hypothetical protein
MSISRLLVNGSLILVSSMALLLPACSVNVKKNEDETDKKVDIETPFGGIHVSKDADARDTGLSVYPGARPRQKEESGEEKSANVTMSAGSFGLKVVAVEYESDDQPAKLITYYTKELGKYGTVLQCHNSWHGKDVNVNIGENKNSSELTCDNSNGNTTELKVGTKNNQHIVAIEPEGKGSKFALVAVQVHGKDETI